MHGCVVFPVLDGISCSGMAVGDWQTAKFEVVVEGCSKSFPSSRFIVLGSMEQPTMGTLVLG
jgi:hypothetical protein